MRPQLDPLDRSNLEPPVDVLMVENGLMLLMMLKVVDDVSIVVNSGLLVLSITIMQLNNDLL